MPFYGGGGGGGEGSSGPVSWSSVTGKPTTFSPAPHNHDGVYAPYEHEHSVDDLSESEGRVFINPEQYDFLVSLPDELAKRPVVLGTYETFPDAQEAYDNAEIAYDPDQPSFVFVVDETS